MKLHRFNRSSFHKAFLVFLVLSGVSFSSFAKVTLPALFTDNMVLQQQSDAPVWGKATPGKNVTLLASWDKMIYQTRVAADGTWRLKVKTPAASLTPYSLTISDGKAVTLHNVLIGEVWICSGQSNMEMPLADWGKIADYQNEIAKANFPNIRLLQVEKATNLAPQGDLKVRGGSWQICSSSTIPLFSATAYFFGRNLYQNLQIPIGLIHSSWGGTTVEAWTSEQSLEKTSDFTNFIREVKKMPSGNVERDNFMNQKQVDWKNELIAKDRGYKDNEAVWAKTDVDDSDWKSMFVPQFWDEQGFADFDGVIWLRKTIQIPSEWQGHNLTLNLGMIDDNDLTFFNGHQIGSSEGWDRSRTYTVPGKLVKAGKAVITVRVFDTGGGGGIHGDKDAVNIYLLADKKTDLSGNWHYAVGLNLKDVPQPTLAQNSQNNPTSLYNAMIHPLIPYAFKGVIWYQGEANVDRAYQYRDLFPLLIQDWRKQWNSEFPFYFVQIANYQARKPNPEPSEWAEVREAQATALHLGNTGMAVIIDIGEGGNIHPKNKQEVGRRLALLARNKTYSQNIVSSGPVYDSYKIDGGKIVLRFKNAEDGLVIENGDTLKGFAIAGPDHTFYWADAKIVGTEIVVSSPQVEFPVAVRYAWADNPDCNLVNKASLPASPFRTDDWAGMTFQKR
jgi:sialate O-acetylesterase